MTASPPDLSEALAARIARDGPIPVAEWMALSNAHYYATRDPFGARGDFITAPEISQMFGELIGAWGADLWTRAGKPHLAYVELGPGRGTLAQDALRAMAKAGLTPPVHFVETSPVLRGKQAERVDHAHFHDTLDRVPHDRPLLIIANEFFDALPVRQFVKTITGWRERMVGETADGFASVPGERKFDHVVPERIVDADPGGIFETSPACEAMAAAIAKRLRDQGGAALIIDYGYAHYAAGDTLQAVHAHAYADPFARPGNSDLTAHVDFTALAEAVHGVRVSGPVTQGDFLVSLGIGARAARLIEAYPSREHEIEQARRRLVDPEDMGHLFKALALTSEEWPEPAGFGESL